ncbi:hypothetical protein ACHAXH_001992 [Discostella pseudostelligera]
MVRLFRILLLLLPLSSFTAAAFTLPDHRASSNLISRSKRTPPASSSSSPDKTTITSLHATSTNNNNEFTGFGNTGILILAGGTGSRMKSSIPKQFLTLSSHPVLHYSLHLFLEKLPNYCHQHNLSPPCKVVLVIDPMYQPEYQSIVDAYDGQLVFAKPGKERQGSVENGLNKLFESTSGTCEYVAVHDSARPLVTIPEILAVVSDAQTSGAAVLGVPCKATIKESADGGATVLRTIPRERLWEVHTPQVVRVEALLRGFAKVEAENLAVTDDVSIIEALGETVRLTRGEYANLKITTPEDMDVASAILKERGEGDIALKGTGGGGSGSSSESVAVDDSSSSPSMLFPPVKRAGEKAYNSMKEVRFIDMDRDSKPTPSRWHE